MKFPRQPHLNQIYIILQLIVHMVSQCQKRHSGPWGSIMSRDKPEEKSDLMTQD